jgi:hypothetical protein
VPRCAGDSPFIQLSMCVRMLRLHLNGMLPACCESVHVAAGEKWITLASQLPKLDTDLQHTALQFNSALTRFSNCTHLSFPARMMHCRLLCIRVSWPAYRGAVFMRGRVRRGERGAAGSGGESVGRQGAAGSGGPGH